MTYEVYLNNNLLYYPNDANYVIFNAKLETALNEAGEFECDIPNHNLRYADFDNGAQLRSGIITVLKEGVEIFCGEVRECTQNFDFTKHIYAVGELAYLFDSIQPQHRYQGTVTAMFSTMLAYHNSQVEARKQYRVGNVRVTDANNYVYHYTNREDTLSAIREKLCDTLNGFLKIRKVNGVKYLDLIPLDQYGRYCAQEIMFGENLLDYAQNFSANDIATCVIPLGVRLEDDQRTINSVEGLDEYLTIRGTSVDEYHKRTEDDYVYIQNAVNTFGWVRVVKEWDEVTQPENLKLNAEKWLKEAQYSHMEIELSAVDLSLINSDFDSFEVGDTVHCWAEPYGMDTTFPVRKKTIYINDLSKNTLVLSNTDINRSYTSQQSNIVSLLEDEIPETYPVLEEAKKRALTMLLDETQGGHVVYEYHYNSTGEADYIIAINICNANTIEKSTQRWRWSERGFGYMTRPTTSSAWPDIGNVKAAITMNGEIVADFITTGTMAANRMRGGVLSLGGSQQGAYKNGQLYVYNSADQEIGHWTNAGVAIKAGTLTLGNKASLIDGNTGVYMGSDGLALGANSVFKVTNAGAVSASNIDITGGSITIKNGNDEPFKVTNKGAVTAGNISITGGSITIKDDANTEAFKVTNKGAVTAKNLNLTGGSINIKNVFKVSSSGAVTATNLKLNGGSINLSNVFKVSSSGAITATSGKIGGFTLSDKDLTKGDAIVSEGVIGCGKAGQGIVNLVGKTGSGDYGYIQISNSGEPDECLNGIRIYGNGKIERYDQDGNLQWDRFLSNIPTS